MAIRVTQAQYDELTLHIRELEQEYDLTVKRIADAKKEGDLSENAQYETAMRDKERIESELSKAKHELSQMRITSESISKTNVSVPCTVVVKNLSTDENIKLQLVSAGGRPPDRVSAGSKFGALLLGKRIGAVICYVDNAYREQRFQLVDIL